MKKIVTITAILVFGVLTASAKTIEITIQNVRNDNGLVLAMATIAGQEKSIYGSAAAKEGAVVLSLEINDATTATISLFHDEDGDYQMKMGQRGPEEGYAQRKWVYKEGRNTFKMLLSYPPESK